LCGDGVHFLDDLRASDEALDRRAKVDFSVTISATVAASYVE
jgi:hypothetical protein